MPKLECDISQSLWDALNVHQQTTGESVAHIVQRALGDALQVDQHTLFQVSTSGALVEGLYQGSVAIETLKQHGDFGLGTFEDLDGEMIVLNGHFYQARCDGLITEAPNSAKVPFSVVTHFTPDRTETLKTSTTMNRLSTKSILTALQITSSSHFDVTGISSALKFVRPVKPQREYP